MELPKHNDINQTGNIASSIVQLFFEKQGWIFRSADGTTDYGIDGEVEIVDDNLVTGKLIKCQIKGTKSIKFEKEASSVQINVSTWNNWSNYQVPVVAVLCDIETERIYWCLPLSFEPKENAKTLSLKFLKSSNLRTEINMFASIVDSWTKSFPSQNILLTIPYYHELFETGIMQYAGWGDPWCDVSSEESNLLKLFYFHVLELRSSVGLRNDSIFPYNYWMIRNQGLWGDGLSLFNGTYDEIAHYIKPLYEEAINKVKRRLKKVKLNFENLELVNYFKFHPLNEDTTNITIDIDHPSSKDKLFHNMIEKSLSQRGFNKFNWAKKTTDNNK